MDLSNEPVRKIALPFAGDPWAQSGAQIEVPDDVPRLRVNQSPIRWRVVPYNGTGPSAAPVDGDATTLDQTIVKLRGDERDNVTLARTTTVVELMGVEQLASKQYTERDVTPAEIVVIGVISVTQDTAAALWIFADAGLEEAP